MVKGFAFITIFTLYPSRREWKCNHLFEWKKAKFLFPVSNDLFGPEPGKTASDYHSHKNTSVCKCHHLALYCFLYMYTEEQETLTCCPGGETRLMSMSNGLASLMRWEKANLILYQTGSRGIPFNHPESHQHTDLKAHPLRFTHWCCDS